MGHIIITGNIFPMTSTIQSCALFKKKFMKQLFRQICDLQLQMVCDFCHRDIKNQTDFEKYSCWISTKTFEYTLRTFIF